MRQTFLIFSYLVLAACGRDAPNVASHPAATEVIANESELLRLTLTPEAVTRLGIATTKIAGASMPAHRQAAGEIVVQPTSAAGIPTGSRVDLQQMGSLQASADSELARAAAQSRLARIALDRAEGLVAAEAGSARSRDEAAAANAAAEAALAAARTQRQLLGPAIADMSQQSVMWVRVSVFAADLASIERSGKAAVRALGAGAVPRDAKPVQAPPSANAAAGTIDLFYSLPNADHAFHVGQRVAVDLPLGGLQSGLLVPSSAVVRDIYGGEWVYEQTAANTYVRQRIEIAAETSGRVLLRRGLRDGAEVVTAGAAELFGTEFGAAH